MPKLSLQIAVSRGTAVWIQSKTGWLEKYDGGTIWQPISMEDHHFFSQFYAFPLGKVSIASVFIYSKWVYRTYMAAKRIV